MSRASNLAGFITAISPTTDLNVGILTAASFDLGGTISFDDIAATGNIAIGGTVAGVTTITGTGINQPLGINTLGQTEFKGAVEFNDNVSSLTIASVTTINSDGVKSTGIGTFSRVAIGTDSPDYDLHVYGAGDILIEDSGSGSAHLRLRSSNNGTDVSNWKIKTSSNNFLYIENDTVGGAPAFTIDNSGKIGIKDATPSVSLDLASTSDSVALPVGTTAQRPSTAYGGYIRWNSTNTALEVYNGTNWVEIISDYFPSGSTTLG